MVWPFRRRTVAEEPGGAEPAESPAPPQRAWREWAAVPALQPVGITTSGLTVSDAGGFPSTLATSWHQAPILQPLGHELSLCAPAGLTSGIVAPVEGYGNEPELTWRDVAEDAPALPQLPVVQAQAVPIREVAAPEPPAEPRNRPLASEDPLAALAEPPAAVRQPVPARAQEENLAADGAPPNPVSPPPVADVPSEPVDEPAVPSPRVRRVGRIGAPLNVDPVPPSVLAGPAEEPARVSAPPVNPQQTEPGRPVPPSAPAVASEDDGQPVAGLTEPPTVDARPLDPYTAAVTEEPRRTPASSAAEETPAPDAPARPTVPTWDGVRSPVPQPAPDVSLADPAGPPPAAGLSPEVREVPVPEQPVAATPAAPQTPPRPEDLAPPDPDEYTGGWSNRAIPDVPAVRPLVSAQPLVAPEVTDPISVLPGLVPQEHRAAADGTQAPDEDERSAAAEQAPGYGSPRPALPGGPAPSLPGWRPPTAGPAQARGAFPGRPAPQPGVPPLEDEYFPPPPGQEDAPPAGIPDWLSEALANAGPDSPLRMAMGATPPAPAAYPGQPKPQDLPPPDPDEYGGSWTGGPTGPDIPAARPRQRRMGRIGEPLSGDDPDPEPAAAPHTVSAPQSPPTPDPMVPTPSARVVGDTAHVDDDGDPIENDVMNGMDDEADAANKEHDDAKHLDQLAGKLYGRMRDQLRRELLVDRERSLTLTDWRT
jgi:hypothetical protein